MVNKIAADTENPDCAAIQRPLGSAATPVVFDEGALVFVLALWTLAFLGALILVARQGRSFPFLDELNLVPVLTGNQPFTASWLWQQHNEHRIVLPKLLYIIITKLAHYDFRAPAYFNISALALLSLALVFTLRKLRGWTSYADAYFPLALLNWGNSGLWWGMHIQFESSTLLAGLFLILIVGTREKLTVARAILGGTCMIALSLCGGNGLILTPFLGLWLATTAVLQWRAPDGEGKAPSVVSLCFVFALAVVIGCYFIGFSKPLQHPPSPGLRATVKASLVVLASNFGSFATGAFWPVSGVIVPILLLISLVSLIWPLRRAADETFRRLGLLLFLGAATCLCLAVAHGRAGMVDFIKPGAISQNHYNAFPIPLLACVFLISELYGTRIGKQVFQMAMLVLGCMTFALQAPATSWQFGPMRHQNEAIKEDLRQGITPAALAERRQDCFCHCMAGCPPVAADCLRMLRDKRIGEFGRLLPDEHAAHAAKPSGEQSRQSH